MPDTLVDHVSRQVAVRAGEPALYLRVGGRWAPITWGQFGAAARRIAAHLLDRGLTETACVVLWVGIRPEWHIADAAIMQARLRSLVLAGGMSVDAAASAARDAGATAAVVDTADQARALLAAGIAHAIVIDGDAEGAGGVRWTAALEHGSTALGARESELQRRAMSVHADDVATLTAGLDGTTGALTHADLVTAAAALPFALTTRDDVLNCCPLATTPGRIVGELAPLACGAATWFPSRGSLADDLRDAHPTVAAGPGQGWDAVSDAGRRGLAGMALRAGLGGAGAVRRRRQRLGLERVRVAVTAGAPRPRTRESLAALDVELVDL